MDIPTVIIFEFVPLFFIANGLILIFKKDWAWWLTEAVLSHVNPQRTTQWEEGTTRNGLIMIAGGIAMGIYMLFVMLGKL